MGTKITIFGAGNVGATIAYTLTVTGMVSDIVLVDINKEKALGEALDIYQGTPFSTPINVYEGGYEDAIGSDIVIITSGVPRKVGQSRLDLAQNNVEIIKSIAAKIVKYAPNAIYIIVSNPVDILTYVFIKESGLPAGQVIGSGTILDTSRLRARLADHFKINQRHVHAYVLGEHGDHSVFPWSLCKVSNLSLEQYCESVRGAKLVNTMPDFKEMEDQVRKSGGTVIAQKGATYYAIAITVCYICNCIFNDNGTVLALSNMLNGEFGIYDVCLSMPFIVGKGGIRGELIPPLTEDEQKQLVESAHVLRNMLNSLKI